VHLIDLPFEVNKDLQGGFYFKLIDGKHIMNLKLDFCICSPSLLIIDNLSKYCNAHNEGFVSLLNIFFLLRYNIKFAMKTILKSININLFEY